MKQKGTVVALKDGFAVVRVEKPSSCGDNCGMCNMCEKGKIVEVKVINGCEAKVGDKVFLTVSSAKSLLLCGITFFLPLLIFFLVYAMRVGTVFSVISLMASFVLCACLSNFLAKKKSFMSEISLAGEYDEGI